VAFSVETAGDACRRAWPLLVMRKAELGDLETLLKSEQQGLLTIEFRTQLFAEVVEAVYLLHACGRHLIT
jgi:hypothetical protein